MPERHTHALFLWGGKGGVKKIFLCMCINVVQPIQCFRFLHQYYRQVSGGSGE